MIAKIMLWLCLCVGTVFGAYLNLYKLTNPDIFNFVIGYSNILLAVACFRFFLTEIYEKVIKEE